MRTFRGITLSRSVHVLDVFDILPIPLLAVSIWGTKSTYNEQVDRNDLGNFLTDDKYNDKKNELIKVYNQKKSIVMLFPIDYDDDTSVSVSFDSYNAIFTMPVFYIAAGNWIHNKFTQ